VSPAQRGIRYLAPTKGTSGGLVLVRLRSLVPYPFLILATAPIGGV
jgi:hypothetical protein